MATRNEKFLRAALGGARGWRLSEETKVPPPRHPRERPQASVGPGRKGSAGFASAVARPRRAATGMQSAPATSAAARGVTWQGGEAEGTRLQLSKATASTW